jgi:acyl-CoA reductase-like NAD-dependent aldehyde dehydrogenase
MQLITELISQIGLPPGVFNLVNGDRDLAEAFLEHPKVKGVSVVGRSATCRIIAEKCARANKRFLAMGGAKNHLVVMPDAKVDEDVSLLWYFSYLLGQIDHRKWQIKPVKSQPLSSSASFGAKRT